MKGILSLCGALLLLLNSNLGAAQVNKQFATFSDSLYKRISPRTLQRFTGFNSIDIVVPEHAGWRQLGDRMKKLLENKGAAKVNVQVADAAKFARGWSGNTILLGNLGNNKQMARLYGLRLSYADAVYPGKGGYQLLTLIDPFGLGGNTIVIGASDLAGARLGIDRISSILEGEKNAAIPWLFEAKLAESTAGYFTRSGKSSAESEKALLLRANVLFKALKPVKGSEVVADALLALISELKIYSEYYQLTAQPEYGKMYRHLLKGYARFVNSYPAEALAQLHERRNMWVQGEKIMQNWTVLEASPIFSEADRAEILSALYLMCEANARDRYLVIAPENAPRWNHEIFPAMSIVGAAYYFEKYYSMPEVGAWVNAGDRIFTGNTSYISMDEGSDYLSHLPMVNIDYAMATGNLKYIDKRLRPSADLHSMMIDNLGTLSGGGDTYPFGMSSAYSWGHSQVLNAASWHYQDPVYNFLLERTRTGPFPGQKMPDLNYPIHRYIVDVNHGQISNSYPRVQAQELEPGVYDELKRIEKGTQTVDQTNTFHKLTFRSGFDTSDSYLILDGFSAGKHGHQDGNAILNYSAKGRLFLHDRDYIQNTPEYHSGLVIVKNGEQYKKPSLVKLQWVADLGGTSISRSTVPSYNNADWDRTIISPDGKFFIVYDDLTFNESGSYLVKNLWQSLGTPKIDQTTFDVEQKGVSMRIQSLTDALLRTKDIYGHFIKYWKTVYPYPYADKETVLAQVINEKKYLAGDKTGFINILSSHTNESDALKAIRINGTTIEITNGGLNWLAVKGGIQHTGFSSNGTFHLLSNNELLAGAVTNVKIGAKSFHFEMPVFFKLNTGTGQWKTYSLLKNRLRYSDQGEPVRQVALDSGLVDIKDLNYVTLRTGLAGGGQSSVNNGSVQKPVVPFTGKRIYSFNEVVSSSANGDLNGDHKDEIILAGVNGKINAITSTGDLLWAFSAKGRVNEVSIQQADGRPLIFIATENWYMQVLDAGGKELWSYKFNDDPTHKEYKGNLIGITNIRVTHTNGKDREPVIMVGTQFRYIYELDLQGKILSDTLLYFYGIEDMEYADLDGDGKDEGIFALEYYYYALRKGKNEIAGKTGGPGFKVAEVVRAYGKETQPSVLLGSKQNEVKLIHFKDNIQEMWVKNVGGEVNDIRHGDYNKDGNVEILIGTEGFQFYVLDKTGKTIVRKTLNDRVLKVEGFTKGAKSYYLAAIAGGRLSTLSASGEILDIRQFPSEIANILRAHDSSQPVVVLENGYVYQLP